MDILHKYKIHPDNAHIPTVLFIGDSFKDVQVAQKVGCDVVLVKTGKGEQTLAQHRDELTDVPVFDDLSAVVDVYFAVT